MKPASKRRTRPARKPRSPRRSARLSRRAKRWLLISSAALLSGFGAAAAWWWHLLDGAGPARAPVSLSWRAGMGAREAADACVAAGLSDSPRALALYFALTRAPRCFVPGPHRLTPLGARAVAQQLCRDAERPAVKVTLPEGLNRFATADRMDVAGVAARGAFLRATVDRALLGSLGLDPPAEDAPAAADSAEGFLFPATYTLRLDSDPDELVRVLVREADRRWRQAVERRKAGFAALSAMGLSRRQIVTLASMVEKEAAADDERPLIASVFVNRLRDPDLRRLQSDPTSMYGCYAMPERIPACSGFNGKATPELNRDAQNAYSTYIHPGLPPGPVANPGQASLDAVLAPANTPFRYFVAKGGGRHAFSETYEQHLAAVKALRER